MIFFLRSLRPWRHGLSSVGEHRGHDLVCYPAHNALFELAEDDLPSAGYDPTYSFWVQVCFYAERRRFYWYCTFMCGVNFMQALGAALTVAEVLSGMWSVAIV